MKNRVVVIGAGLGGLSAAAIAAQHGYAVTVLEQQRVAGGCLQCFSRHGARFETGMHFVGAAEDGQILDRILHLCGVRNMVTLAPLDNIYNIISLAGERHGIAAGREAFVDTLARSLRCSTAPVTRIFDAIRRCARQSALYSPTATPDPNMMLRSIADILSDMRLPQQLVNVLGGDASLYAGRINATPFATMAFLKDFYSDGAYRFDGGSDTLVNAFIRQIEAYGGTIVTNARVAHIHCDSRGATSVETKNGNRYPADFVISAIHPSLLPPMIESGHLRPAYVKRITGLVNTTAAFTVYLRFKPRTMPYMPYNLFGYNSPNPWTATDYNATDWPRGWLYMHHHDGIKDGYAMSGQIITYMNYADVAPWHNSYIGSRPTAYSDFKRQRAETLLRDVERQVPSLTSAVAEYYTSTPLTYRDYNNTPQGALYGVAKDITISTSNRVSHRTRIPNLLLAGQNINSHGMLGVLVGSLVACSDLPDINNLFTQLYD